MKKKNLTSDAITISTKLKEKKNHGYNKLHMILKLHKNLNNKT
jgi:ppGpp synthetase/RelA/SpoT-type nucleotidyltranferase